MPSPNIYEQGKALADAMYVHGRQKSGDIVTNLLTRIDEMGRDLEEARKTLVNAGEQYGTVIQENEFLKGSLATCGRLINEVRDMTNANADACDVCAQLHIFVGETKEPEDAVHAGLGQDLREAYAEPEEGSDDSK